MSIFYLIEGEPKVGGLDPPRFTCEQLPPLTQGIEPGQAATAQPPAAAHRLIESHVQGHYHLKVNTRQLIKRTEKKIWTTKEWVVTRGGKSIFLKSPQIANLQTLWIIPQSQIRRFLRCTSPQIANLQFFYLSANHKIANFCILLHYSVVKQS